MRVDFSWQRGLLEGQFRETESDGEATTRERRLVRVVAWVFQAKDVWMTPRAPAMDCAWSGAASNSSTCCKLRGIVAHSRMSCTGQFRGAKACGDNTHGVQRPWLPAPCSEAQCRCAEAPRTTRPPGTPGQCRPPIPSRSLSIACQGLDARFGIGASQHNTHVWMLNPGRMSLTKCCAASTLGA